MSDAPRRLLGSRGASQGGGNDVGSRTLPAGLGFQGACHHEFGLCLVTGYPDNGISRDTALAHLSDIVAATDVPILPISRAASPRTPQVSRKAFILPWRPAWPGCRSRIRRAIQRGRSMHSARPSRGCVRHAGPSTRQAVMRCSSGVLSAFWWVRLISFKRSPDSRPMHRPVPIACTRRASGHASRLRRGCYPRQGLD